MKSMTGFGRATLESGDVAQEWEIRSVNGRHLDIKWRLPLFIRPLEGQFERIVRRHATRGRLDISLKTESLENAGFVRFNHALGHAMLQELAAFAGSRGEAFQADYTSLLGYGFLWEDEKILEADSLFSLFAEGLEKTLCAWNDSRIQEGNFLRKDIADRLAFLKAQTLYLEGKAPEVKKERFLGLRRRLDEILAETGAKPDEGRLLQEIAFLADKLDVSEELTRLTAHLESMEKLLESGGEVGRRLDFTLQEAFREITTCGNKIQDAALSHVVVEIKNELEKCREQVQNIE